MSFDPHPNPYQAPNLEAVRYEFRAKREAARQAVKGPAIGLICIASVSILLGLLGLVLDVVLLVSGAAKRADPESYASDLVVRAVWGLIMLANSGFAVWAGISMQRLKQHQLCWLAGILACIPCLGPCFCLGIPFGIWAITVLNRSEVAEAFD